MNKKCSILLAVSLSFLLTSSTSAKLGPGTSAAFCPECWEYVWGAGSTDMKGNCAACGKYPVQLEVQVVQWWWCSQKKGWLESPCLEITARRCCSGEESLALTAPSGSGMFQTFYCPAHRSFRTIALPMLGTRVCASCGRPAVPAFAMSRAWYRCQMEGVWAPEACEMNPVRKCCTKREGLLLVKAQSGPIASR
jgi:hypothetical protein